MDADNDIELIVWFGASGEIEGFQLCYYLIDNEYALTWRKGKGYSHNKIDEGEDTPLKNLSPILIPDGIPAIQRLSRLFAENSGAVEDAIRRFVLDRFEKYPV